MATVKGTWVFNDVFVSDSSVIESVNFFSAGQLYTEMHVWTPTGLEYKKSDGDLSSVFYEGEWYEEEYKTITFQTEQEVSDEFYEFLVAEAKEVVEMLVVNTTKLEQDLTTIADAIRTSGGTSEPLEFPQGYVEAIEPLGNKNEYLADILNCTVSEIVNEKVTIIPAYFQYGNANLTKCILPNVTGELRGSEFTNCKTLKLINLNSVTSMVAGTFNGCYGLKKVCFPSLTTITGYGYNFNNNSSLKQVYFPVLTASLTPSFFNGCKVLDTLILGADVVCALSNTNVFNNTPIKSGTGYVYVKKALVEDYKIATNWSTYATQIRAIEDYTEVLEGWE